MSETKKAYSMPNPACHPPRFTSIERLGTCILAVLAAVAVVVPGAAGQPPPPTPDATTVAEERAFSILPGFRMEFRNETSLGGSLQFIYYLPKPSPWLSLQMHGQVSKKREQHNVTLHDNLFFGRFMGGYGRGNGPSAFAFLDFGRGTIQSDDLFGAGDSFTMWGIGVGVGLSFWGITAKLDASTGGARKLKPEGRNTIAATLQYRVY